MADDRKTPQRPEPPQPQSPPRQPEPLREKRDIDAGRVVKVERPEAWPPPPAKREE
jgi:hypothetical protein